MDTLSSTGIVFCDVSSMFNTIKPGLFEGEALTVSAKNGYAAKRQRELKLRGVKGESKGTRQKEPVRHTGKKRDGGRQGGRQEGEVLRPSRYG
ncbi:hypothetical protein AGIG_G1815 [Arapaima gigas]